MKYISSVLSDFTVYEVSLSEELHCTHTYSTLLYNFSLLFSSFLILYYFFFFFIFFSFLFQLKVKHKIFFLFTNYFIAYIQIIFCLYFQFSIVMAIIFQIINISLLFDTFLLSFLFKQFLCKGIDVWVLLWFLIRYFRFNFKYLSKNKTKMKFLSLLPINHRSKHIYLRYALGFYSSIQISEKCSLLTLNFLKTRLLPKLCSSMNHHPHFKYINLKMYPV